MFQSYSESSSGGAGGLASTLVTSVSGSSVSVGNNSTAPSGLSTALNSNTPHHSQPSKSLPGKLIYDKTSFGK